MALLEQLNDEWVFARGKFAGETLKQVAKEQPSYLQWVFENATDGLSDDAFHALEDMMEENEIEIP